MKHCASLPNGGGIVIPQTPYLCSRGTRAACLHSQCLQENMKIVAAEAYEEACITQDEFRVCQHGARVPRNFRDSIVYALSKGTGCNDLSICAKCFNKWVSASVISRRLLFTHAVIALSPRSLLFVPPTRYPPLNTRPTGTLHCCSS